MACLPGNRFDNGQKNETHDCPRGASWADTDFGTCTGKLNNITTTWSGVRELLKIYSFESTNFC